MADYPTALPSFAANGANLSTAPHSALHTDLNNEVLAIATELGLAPSDTFSTVKARLDALNARVVTAEAELAAITPVPGAWTTWVPAVVQLGSVTVTVNRASHIRAGRWLHTDGYVSVTGSGTASNLITVTLPATAASSNANTILGRGWIFDSSTGLYYKGDWVMNSATTAKLDLAVNGGATGYAGTSVITVGLASGDLIAFQWDYELASDA